MNIQTIPATAKHIFIPEEGNVFIQADFSNLEVRVLSYISDDEVLQEIFEKGLNLHDVNTKLLFGISETHPKWKQLRRVAKTYIFGRNYGGSLQGMYKRIALADEDFDLTFKEFERMDRTYFSKHPKYAEWRQEVERTLRVKRELVNCFGRKRIFLGSDSDILREGLNFPVQSSAGDIMSKGIISVYENRTQTAPFSLCITVHDSLVVQTAISDAVKVSEFLIRNLEQKHQIGKYNVGFPVDVEIGFSYGNMIPLDVWVKMKDHSKQKVDKYCKLLKTEEFSKLSIEDRLRRI